MKITVLGTGNAGTAMAADLTKKGHIVNLLKTSNSKNDNFEFIVSHNNKVVVEDLDETYAVTLNKVTRDYEEAFREKQDVIVIFIQTKYHEMVISKLAKYLEDNQVVFILPGYLSTAYIKKHSNKEVVVVEGESSPIDCRLVEPGRVKVLFKNVRNPIGIYPENKSEETFRLMEGFDYNFTSLTSVVEAALHNPNLIVHTIGSIMSIPRIEYSNGNYSMYREVFTPTIMNLVKELDREKIEILERLHLPGVNYVDACKFRNSEDLTLDSLDVFFDYANNSSPRGPFIAENRYIIEDVPEGLVMMESIAKVLGIATPATSGLINIASACLTRDFRKGGRTVDRLGIENIREIIKDR